MKVEVTPREFDLSASRRMLDAEESMARHHSSRDFFRQMPNALLARCFHARTAFVEKLAALSNHFARAMVTFLDHNAF